MSASALSSAWAAGSSMSDAPVIGHLSLTSDAPASGERLGHRGGHNFAKLGCLAYHAPVNFFGHVVVTSWLSSEPAIALGSMLPDLANMCRGRLGQDHDADIARGIQLHHRTDKVFHTCAPFSDLERDTGKRLQARGVNRGGALGTAHVAVELLLDGLLLDDADAAQLYLAALDCPAGVGAGIAWREPDQASRWAALRARMRRHGLPDGYRDPDVVTDRVALILSNYKTLALTPAEVDQVRAEMTPLRERVSATMPAIMSALRTAFTDHTIDDVARDST